MKLLWSPLALERVAEIAAMIAEDRPNVSEHWVEKVFTAVERLRDFPESGRVVPELQRAEVREVIHGRYRIIYRVEHEQVAVLTVRHSRQLTGPEDIEP